MRRRLEGLDEVLGMRERIREVIEMSEMETAKMRLNEAAIDQAGNEVASLL